MDAGDKANNDGRDCITRPQTTKNLEFAARRKASFADDE